MDNEKQAFIAGYELALRQWSGANTEYPATRAEEQFELWKQRQTESKEN